MKELREYYEQANYFREARRTASDERTLANLTLLEQTYSIIAQSVADLQRLKSGRKRAPLMHATFPEQ
jgi:hypothetical protein